jgi:hypothetical protein
MFERTILYSRLINSSAGMVGPDDLDCYNRMQQALLCDASDWVDMRRYFGKDELHDDKRTGTGTSDLTFRNQYDAWLQFMTRAA